jgi:hypothetical protein
MPSSGSPTQDTKPPEQSSSRFIFWLAIIIVTFGAFAIAALAFIIILRDTTPEDRNTMTVFNVLVPVFASWVGTILAFYFGRENFVSAADQVRKSGDQVISMAQQPPDERASQPVSAIMRAAADTQSLTLPAQGEVGVTIAGLLEKFSGADTRLPILDATKAPKYMIHRSAVDGYLAGGTGRGPANTFKDFLDAQATQGLRYDNGSGFVLVSPTTTVADAKAKLMAVGRAKDIFVSATGKSGEPLVGWLSDTRLLKELQA